MDDDGGSNGEGAQLFTDEQCRRNLHFNIGLAVFEALLLLAFMVLTRKVFQKVQWNDKYVLAMLFFLQLHIVFNVVFYSMNAALYTNGLC